MTEIVTIPQALRRAAEQYGERVALISKDERVTYSEYLQRVEGVAGAMISRGILPGDRVVIWAPNSVEFAIVANAIYFVGAIVVPINSRFKVGEAEDVILRSRARGLFASTEFLGRDFISELAERRAIEQLEFAVAIDDGKQAELPLSVFAEHGSLVDVNLVREREQGIESSTVSDVVYTSGTTGQPKGAMLQHGPSVRAFTEFGRSLGLTHEDNLLGVPPFFHTFGLKGNILTAILYGAGLVPMAVFSAREAAQIIADERISVLQGAPTICLDLINDPEIDHKQFSSLRVAQVGASGLGAEGFRLIRDELGIQQFANGYALTESHGIAARVYAWDDFETAATTSGRAAPGLEIRIVLDSGQEAAPGEVGEILVRGYSVMAGYLDDPEATAEAIDSDGWLHTGDLGYLDDQQRLTVKGRKKEMVIVGGFNAYPAEIEALICRHPAVKEAAVIGVPDDRLGQVCKAFVLLRAGASATPEEILSFSRGIMANYKAPRQVEILAEFPRNQSGKVMKSELSHEPKVDA